jgi:dTDP-glucose pyrophosphorylase
MTSPESGVIALIPAAGRGNRIAPLPCSKELYPIGFRLDPTNGELRPKVSVHYLLEKLFAARIARAYVILRDGKWDIPAYLGDGAVVGMHLAYLVTGATIGPPDTLDRAYPFVGGASIALGFPDMLFGPDDAYQRLLERLHGAGADIVVGLYRAHDCRKMDMVDFDDAGRVRSVTLKPRSSSLQYAWLCAVWRPAFTEFMHRFVAAERERLTRAPSAYRELDAQGDLPMGAVIKAAVESGLEMHGVPFPDDSYIDIGTPDDLERAVTRFHSAGRGGEPT